MEACGSFTCDWLLEAPVATKPGYHKRRIGTIDDAVNGKQSLSHTKSLTPPGVGLLCVMSRGQGPAKNRGPR